MTCVNHYELKPHIYIKFITNTKYIYICTNGKLENRVVNTTISSPTYTRMDKVSTYFCKVDMDQPKPILNLMLELMMMTLGGRLHNLPPFIVASSDHPSSWRPSIVHSQPPLENWIEDRTPPPSLLE